MNQPNYLRVFVLAVLVLGFSAVGHSAGLISGTDFAGDNPEAIVLDLVHPVLARRRLRGIRG